MATVVARLEAILSAQTRDFERDMKRAEGQTSGFGKTLGTAKLAAAGFAIGGVAVATKFLGDSVKAAINAQQQQARLAQAFDAAHMSLSKYEPAIKQAESAGRKLGFSNADLRQSIGSLITATQDYTKTRERLNIAEDLARYKGVSLEQATKALTMASAGSTRFLKQLGILTPTITDAQNKLRDSYTRSVQAVKDHYQGLGKLSDAQKQQEQNQLLLMKANEATNLSIAKQTDKQATIAKAMDIVSQKVHGQADAYSTTAAGAMAQFHAQVEQLQVSIGQKLIPVLTKVLLKLTQLVTWINENWKSIRDTVEPVMKAITFIIGSQLKAIVDLFKFWTDLLHGRWAKAWDDLKGYVVNITAPMRKAAEAVATAVWHGFTSVLDTAWKDIKKSISDLFGKVIGWVKHVLGIKSPSTVFYGIGQNMVQGFIDGVGSMAGALKRKVISIAESLPGQVLSGVGSLLGGGGTGAGGNFGSGYHANSAEAKAFARTQMHGFGWGGGQFADLVQLWNRESGWRWNARNASSGAYGIPQALPPSKMGSVRGDWRDNAFTQIAWGLQYIASRYGSPAQALAHENRFNWYDRGGWLPTGLSLAANFTGQPERVLAPGEGGNVINFNFPNYVGSRQELVAAIRSAAAEFGRRNAGPAFGVA